MPTKNACLCSRSINKNPKSLKWKFYVGDIKSPDLAIDLLSKVIRSMVLATPNRAKESFDQAIAYITNYLLKKKIMYFVRLLEDKEKNWHHNEN